MRTGNERYAAEVIFTDGTREHLTASYGAVLHWLIEFIADTTRVVGSFTVGHVILEEWVIERVPSQEITGSRDVHTPPGVPIGLVTPGDLGVT